MPTGASPEGRASQGRKGIAIMQKNDNRRSQAIRNLKQLLISLENASRAVKQIDSHKSWETLGFADREQFLRLEGILNRFDGLKQAL